MFMRVHIYIYISTTSAFFDIYEYILYVWKIYMYAHLHTYLPTYLHTYIHTYIHTYV